MQDLPEFPIGFGGAAVSGEGKGYGFGEISEEESTELLEAAFEQGIRVFDTAPIYGFGLSEKRIGKAFQSKRSNIFIVSKSGVTWDRNKRVDKNNDPKVTEAMLDQSLKDLKTDYIDLYMIHWPDERVDIRKPMEVLAKRKDKGDILRIGLCNTFQEDFEKASEIAPIEAIQDSWNAFSWYNTYQKYDFLKDQKDIYKMGYSTFDKGILTGRVDEDRKFDSSDCRSWAPWWKSIDKEKKYDLVRKLKALLPEYGIDLADFSLHFAMKQKDFMDVNLVGFRNQKQLDKGLRSIEKNITKDMIEEIMMKWRSLGYLDGEDFG